MRVAALLLLFAPVAAAGELLAPPQEKFVLPKYVMTGVDLPVPLGEIVDISLLPAAPGVKVPDLASSAVQWKVWEFDRVAGVMVEKRVREYEGGVFFGSGLVSKRLFVQAIVTHLYLVKDGARVSEAATRTQVISATLTVGTPGPEPGPGPGPGPGPEPTPPPPLPDGRYGLAKFSYAEGSKVSSSARLSGSRACAKAFRGVSSAARAGTLKTLEQVLREAKVATDAELNKASVSVAPWGEFGTALQEKLYALYKDKKLSTAADMADALDEVAQGLEAIR